MTKNPPAAVVAITGAATVMMLEPREIAPSPTNPRKTFPEATLAELADSMAHDGQVQAIVVRPITVEAITKFNKEHPDAGDEDRIALRFELVSGERRWRAAGLKGLLLRSEVRELTDMQVVRIQIIENLHREEVHPLEEAEGYEYLLRHSRENITVDQIADEVGKSRSYVHKRLKLAALCDDARKQFLAGDFDASTALLIARIPTPQLQVQAIEEIGTIYTSHGDKPSYRQIRDRLAQRFHLELASAPFDITIENLVPGCSSCIACPKRTGNQVALFDDVESKDICTDPDCFESKKKASIARVLEAARKDGLKIVQGDEAIALKPHQWSNEVDGYVGLDDIAYETDDGEEITYQQLAEKAGRKAPKPLLFVDPRREDVMPEKLISDEEALKLFEKFAPKEIVAAHNAQGSGPAADDPAHVAEARERRVQHETRGLLVAALTKKADQPRTISDLVLIACALAGDDMDDALLEAAGVALPPDSSGNAQWDHEAAFVSALVSMEPAALGTFTFRLALGDFHGGYYRGDLPRAALEAAATSHGINLAGIARKAEKRVDKGDEGLDAEDADTP